MASGATRVMLVEDDPHWRELVATLLRRAGRYEVLAPDLDRWVDDVSEAGPDVLLLDLALGDVDAVEQIPRVVGGCPTTMVAALTARSAEQEEAGVRAAGAFVFYEKEDVANLPGYLEQDLALFRRALAGEDVVAPSAIARRPVP